MNWKIGNKSYTLRLRCGKVRELKEKTGAKNLMESVMNAIQDLDVEFMASFLSVVSEEPRVSPEGAYEVLDEYTAQADGTLMSFGNVMLEVLDNAGFLPKKGISKMIAQTMEQEIERVDEKVATEFRGHKA